MANHEDIFKKVMWFGFEGENNWYPIPTSRVAEIQQMNKEGKKPASLASNTDPSQTIAKAITSDLERLDKKYSGKKKPKRRKSRRRPKGQRGRSDR